MLTAYASSSAGNLYEVNDGKTRLLLECGLTYKRLAAAVNHELATFTGCLLTHKHGDHASGAKALVKRGMPVYALQSTLADLGLTDWPATPIEPFVQRTLGTLVILPFPVHHDVDALGYLIYSLQTREKLLFATDTFRLDYRVPGLTEIAIECNHAVADLGKHGHDKVDDRRARAHMSLEAVQEYLAAINLATVQRIHLLHLSGSYGDPVRFRQVIEAQTGKEVVVA